MQNFSLTPGAQIAHYRFERRIGAGGMGEVFLATDLTLERLVALKILPPVLLSDNERVRRFVQEAKSASALNHPNIVTIYEIGQSAVTMPNGEVSDDKVQYMAMEYIEGQTLREMIYGTAQLREILTVLAQSADGLAKAHGAGIVHRDLKPDNIMVTTDGYAKVVDFGLAKLTENSQGTSPTPDRPLTQTGMVMGTIGYMSPEQIDGSEIRPSSDIFAFGCILYEAVAKKRPFQSDLAIDTLHKIMFSEPMPLMAHVPDAPPGLQAVIDRCLKKAAKERYASIRDVSLALREISGSGAIPRPTPDAGIPVPEIAAAAAGRPGIQARPLQEYENYTQQPNLLTLAASAAFKLGLIVAAAILIYVGVTLPDVQKLATGTPPSVTSGTWANYDELGPALRSAAVASVDPDFFERRPLEGKTLGEAAKSINTPERRLYAPSALTSRVAEQIYGPAGANPAAIARIWATATSMQSKLPPRRIVELYLNLSRYGDKVGAADAAELYFKKSARKLTDSEAALLSAAALVPGADVANPSPELLASKAGILELMKAGGGQKASTSVAKEETKKEKPSGKGKKRKKTRGGSTSDAPAPPAGSEAPPSAPPAEPAPQTDTTPEP